MNGDQVPPRPDRQAEPLPRPAASPPDAEVAGVARLHEIAAGFFHERMATSWVPSYLAARGFGTAVQREWQAGYAPAAWDALTRHLRALGFPDTLIEASGLARRSRHGGLTDIFRDRAVLPIRSLEGTVAGFIGRAPEGAGPRVPKYLNSPRTCLYDKGKVLFGLWEGRHAIAAGARPVIVEGPFDAIAVTTACTGHYAGAAPCGTALTAGQVTILSQVTDIRSTGVLVAFDSDQAGRRAATRAYHLLTPHTGKVAAMALPPGQDPAQVFREHGPDALAAIATRTHPLADLVIDAEVDRWSRWLGHAEGQINALRAAAPVIAAMPPADVARQVARLADRLGLDHAAVTGAVTDALPQVIARTAATSPGQGKHGNRASGPRVDGGGTQRVVGPGRSAGAAGSPGHASDAGTNERGPRGPSDGAAVARRDVPGGTAPALGHALSPAPDGRSGSPRNSGVPLPARRVLG